MDRKSSESDIDGADQRAHMHLLEQSHAIWEKEGPEAAVAMLEEANPSEGPAELFEEWASVLESSGRRTAAIAVVERGLALHPESPILRSRRAHLLGYYFGEVERATEEYLALLEETQDADMLHDLVYYLLESKRSPDARGAVENYLALHPGNQKALSLLAEIELHDRNMEGAERLYKEVLDREPSNLDALTGLAELALDRGDPGKAGEYVDRIRVQGTASLRAEQAVARWLIEAKRYSEAEQLLVQITKHLPLELSTLRLLLQLYLWPFRPKKLRQTLRQISRAQKGIT